MVFDSLSVRVTADTGSFERGIDDARSELSKFSTGAFTTAGSLQVVQEAVDETEDEVSSLNRSVRGLRTSLATTSATAGTTSASFASLSASTSGLSFSVGTLSTSFVSLIGTLGLVTGAVTGLLSTLFPLAAVLGTLTGGALALAGAFGAVIGTGILAFGRQRGEQAKERLKDVRNQIDALEDLEETQGELSDANEKQLQELEDLEDKLEDQTGIAGGLEAAVADLRDEIAPLVADFGEKFLPLIEDAVDALPNLVENVLAALGSLNQFKESLRDFGGAVMDAIPNAVVAMVDLAERALPLATRVVRTFGDNALPVFNSMLRVTERLAPVFMQLGRAFVSAVPELTRLGSAILNVALPALSDYLGLVEDIIQLAQNSDGFVDFVRTGMQRLAAWVNGPGLSILSNVASSILNGFNKILSGDSGSQFFSGLTNLLGTVLGRLSTWFNSGGQQMLTNLLTNLFGTLATVLTGQRQTFREQLFTPLSNILASLFDSITGALRSDEAGRLGTAIGKLVAAVGETISKKLKSYVQSERFAQDVIILADAIANVLGNLVVAFLKDSLTNVKISDFAGAGGVAAEAAANQIPTARGPSPQQIRNPKQQQPQGERPVNVQVSVEGDSDLVRSVSAEIVEDIERRSKRQTGGTNIP